MMMKFLGILFLVGFACASFYDDLDDTTNEAIMEFMMGMEEVPSLKEYLGVEGSEYDEMEDNIKTEMGKILKKQLNDIIEKIKDAIDHGKQIKGELKEKAKDIITKLKDMKLEVGEKVKEEIQKMKDKLKGLWEMIREKIGMAKRAVDDDLDMVMAPLNWKDGLVKIRDSILENDPANKIIEIIKKFFPEETLLGKILINTITKGRDVLLKLLNRLIGEEGKPEVESERSVRSLEELKERLKYFFKDLKLDLKEKWAKFGEWVQDVWTAGREKMKSKVDNIKTIGKQFIEHAKNLHQDVVKEALEFFRLYKDDLGTMWKDIKNAVGEILEKNAD